MAKDTFDLSLNLNDNIGSTLQRLDEMTNYLDTVQKQLVKVGDLSDRKVGTSISKLTEEMGSFHDIMKSAASDADFGHNFKSAQKDLAGVTTKLATLRKLSGEYLEEFDKGNHKIAANKAKAYKETFKLIDKEKKAALSSMSEQSKRVKKVFIEDKAEVNKFLKEEVPSNMGGAIGKAFKAFIDKDMGGIIGAVSEGAGSVAQGVGGKARNALDQRGMRREMAGKAPIKGMGGASKALGGIARVLGPLAVAVGGIGMMVKLLMDAESQTKELNQELLSQVPYFALADQGFGKANDRIAQMRESATDFTTNMRLGLDPKQHYEVIGALEEHGGDVRNLAEDYDSFGAMAKDVVETVRTSSLNMGTSLSETAAFVGELRDIHGKSMGEIKSDLTLVTGLSRDAGISTKKFFGTIAQLSGGMGLYNYKLEDAAFLLGNMNKIMDSKSAEAFTTQMVTGLKDMNGQQRMQTMMLAGQGKVRKMAMQASKEMFQDMGKNATGMSSVLKETFGDKFGAVENMEQLEKAVLKMSRSDKNKFIAGVQMSLGEGVSTQLSKAIRMGDNARKGGLHLADAMSDLGAMDSMEIQISSLENMFGSIEKVPSILAESMGINQDSLRQMQRYSEISKGNYGLMKGQVTSFAKSGKTQEQIDVEMKKLNGLFHTSLQYDKKSGKILDGQGKEVNSHYDMMKDTSKAQQDKMKKTASTQMTSAEKQIAATQSVTDILKHVIADLLNTIGSQLTGMNSILLDWFGKGTDKQKMSNTLSSNTSEARGEVYALKRKQRTAKTSTEKAAYGAQLKKAQAKLTAARDTESRFDMSSDRLYNKDGSGKENFKERQEMVSKGFSGTLGGYQKLKNQSAMTVRNKMRSEEGLNGLKTNLAGRSTLNGKASSGGKEVINAIEREREALVDEAVAKQKLDKQALSIQEETLELHKNKAEEGMTIGKATNAILEQKGIKLSEDALGKFQDKMALAMIEAETSSTLMAGGFSPEIARDLAKNIHAGNDMTPNKLRAYGIMNPSQSQLSSLSAAKGGGTPTAKSVPNVEDARIMTRGIAPLAFAPGDLVIKENSLARTQTGGSGSMIKHLAKGSTGGSGGNYNFTVHVNSPQSGDVQKEVLSAYEMIKRKEMGG